MGRLSAVITIEIKLRMELGAAVLVVMYSGVRTSGKCAKSARQSKASLECGAAVCYNIFQVLLSTIDGTSVTSSYSVAYSPSKSTKHHVSGLLPRKELCST